MIYNDTGFFDLISLFWTSRRRESEGKVVNARRRGYCEQTYQKHPAAKVALSVIFGTTGFECVVLEDFDFSGTEVLDDAVLPVVLEVLLLLLLLLVVPLWRCWS